MAQSIQPIYRPDQAICMVHMIRLGPALDFMAFTFTQTTISIADYIRVQRSKAFHNRLLNRLQ